MVHSTSVLQLWQLMSDALHTHTLDPFLFHAPLFTHRPSRSPPPLWPERDRVPRWSSTSRAGRRVSFVSPQEGRKCKAGHTAREFLLSFLFYFQSHNTLFLCTTTHLQQHLHTHTHYTGWSTKSCPTSSHWSCDSHHHKCGGRATADLTVFLSVT